MPPPDKSGKEAGAMPSSLVPSSLMLRVCVVAVTLAALPLVGFACAAEPDAAAEEEEANVEPPAGEPLDLSTPDLGNSGPKALNASKPLAPDWQGKAGIDYRKPAFPAAEFQPNPLVAAPLADQSTGAAWAKVTAPGLDAPLGWDKTVIDTRLDPAQEEGKVGTTLSRSMPIDENFSLTLQNGVSVTRTVPSMTQPPAHTWASSTWASSQALRLDLVPTDTSVSFGTAISSTDEKWLRSLSAEQKLFGGPVSVTGSVSETAAGERAKSLKAGFKATW
jgi:hypothetical protein